MTDGAKANKSGAKLESKVKRLFLDIYGENNIDYVERSLKGLTKKATQSVVKKFSNQQYYKPTLIKQEPYEKTITGDIGKIDFRFVDSFRGKDLMIECKNQNVGGSVDEKFDAILNRIVFNKYYSKNIVVMLDGTYWKNNYLPYKSVLEDICLYFDNNNVVLENRIRDLIKSKDVKVLLFNDFSTWLRGYIGL